MVSEKKVSQRRACRWVGISRNALQEPVAVKEKDTVLKERIETLAHRHKQWGVLKIYRRLRKQGEQVNHKRVRRLYCLSGLNLRRKTRKRLPEAVRRPLVKASACDECWSLDFTSDSLVDGRKFRTLNVIDDYNREALGIERGRPLGLWRGKNPRFGVACQQVNRAGCPMGPQSVSSMRGFRPRPVLLTQTQMEIRGYCPISKGLSGQVSYLLNRNGGPP